MFKILAYCFFTLFFQEDMNLSEEKKTPLRDKDLNTKREMVTQYIFTASKAVSFSSQDCFDFYLTCFNVNVFIGAVKITSSHHLAKLFLCIQSKYFLRGQKVLIAFDLMCIISQVLEIALPLTPLNFKLGK